MDSPEQEHVRESGNVNNILREHSRIRAEDRKQSRFVYAPWIILVVSIFVLIVLIIQWVVMRCETRLIFPGAPVDYYRRLKRGEFYFLKTGGGLLHYSSQSKNHLQGHRRLLFLHGNGGSLDLLAEVLEYLHDICGYDVYALEYYTYGICWKKPKWSRLQKHISSILIENVFDAWSICGDSEAIVCGFSLGGGLLGMTYSALIPSPAQLVFINTFSNLPQLVGESLPLGIGRWIAPLLQTQWITPAPTPYFQSNIVLVSTMDDKLMTRSQTEHLYQLFQHLSPQWLELPDGGHALSLIRYLDRVAALLLIAV
jgi:pimeloyl-ACP methyl ester carboxylesterase